MVSISCASAAQREVVQASVQAKIPHKMTFLCQKENYLEKTHFYLENKVKSDKIPVDIETSFCEESLPVRNEGNNEKWWKVFTRIYDYPNAGWNSIPEN